MFLLQFLLLEIHKSSGFNGAKVILTNIFEVISIRIYVFDSFAGIGMIVHSIKVF